MGSVAFAAEDESQPSTSNCKSSTMILDGCVAVNHASIPKKLRSAIKKRGRESIASPLLISRKQHRLPAAVDTLKKDGAKKSKLNKKQGCITKEEEEVAETLYALAGMFSDANKADQQEIDDEKPEIQSSAALQEDTCPTLRDENRKISSKVTLGAVCPSNVANSTAEEVISQTLEARNPELFLSSKQMASPNASGGQSDLNWGPTSRPLVSILGKHEIQSDQVVASRFQYGNCSFIGDKCKDLFPSPYNMSGTNSGTHKSCPGGRSGLFEGTIFPSQPRVVESKFSTEKYTGVGAESSKSWKRCSAHVYISRLIKVLQISDRPVEPTQPAATCRGAELQSHLSFDNEMLRTNVSNGDTCFGAIDIAAAKKDSSETRDQQMASQTSSKQGYDFLSLGTGTGLCGLDTGESANGAVCFLERPKQYHMPFVQSQNQSTGVRSLPRNGYSSSPAAQQVQLPRYHSSDFRGKTGQQMESQQQKWAAQLQTHYYTGGGGGPRLPDWRNGAVVNYAHSAVFPHLHAALGASRYQQLSPSQQHQLMVANVPLPTKRRHSLPLGFDRNRGVFGPENMAQLQLQLQLP